MCAGSSARWGYAHYLLEVWSPREIRLMHRVKALLLLLIPAGCADTPQSSRTTKDTLLVYEAASLALPMRAVLDSFSRATGAVVSEEHGASLELARRITDLHRTPDVIALADHEVFAERLMPAATSWYAAFARNRMVVAFTPRSRHAAEITPDNWRTVLLRPDVLLGRTDPALAPAGYRALLMYELAETYYHVPGLARRLEQQTPPRLLRGNATELAALLSAGELDYIVEYESVAHAQHFDFIALPSAINLGDPTQAAAYAAASVRVANNRDTITRRGAPILYGVSVPRNALHGPAGARFVAFLLGPDGRRILAAAKLDALDAPVFVGDSIPDVIRSTRTP